MVGGGLPDFVMSVGIFSALAFLQRSRWSFGSFRRCGMLDVCLFEERDKHHSSRLSNALMSDR